MLEPVVNDTHISIGSSYSWTACCAEAWGKCCVRPFFASFPLSGCSRLPQLLTQSVNHLANFQSAFPLSLSSHARPGQAPRTVSSPLEGSGGRQTSVWSCPGTTRRALDMTSPLRTQESRVAHIKRETSAWPTGVHQCCLILTSVMRETELCNQ